MWIRIDEEKRQKAKVKSQRCKFPSLESLPRFGGGLGVGKKYLSQKDAKFEL